MTKKEYDKKIKKHFKHIADDLAAMAVAESKLDFDTACVHLLERLNKYNDFVSEHSPHLQKF